MATIKSNKKHGLFFSLIKQLDGYDSSMSDALKEELVFNASKGKTCSLSELYSNYPRAYGQLIDDLKNMVNKSNCIKPSAEEKVKAEKWRKRCLAAVCSWVDARNISFATPSEKIEYAKGIICRSASCGDFNGIPSSRLTDIYNEFVQKKVISTTRKEVVFGYEICEN